MSSLSQAAATLDELYRVAGKAELIGGRIVPIIPTGRRPNLVAGRIYRSLAGHVENLGRGEVYTDNMGVRRAGAFLRAAVVLAGCLV